MARCLTQTGVRPATGITPAPRRSRAPALRAGPPPARSVVEDAPAPAAREADAAGADSFAALNAGIADFYNSSTALWEDMWGERHPTPLPPFARLSISPPTSHPATSPEVAPLPQSLQATTCTTGTTPATRPRSPATAPPRWKWWSRWCGGRAWSRCVSFRRWAQICWAAAPIDSLTNCSSSQCCNSYRASLLFLCWPGANR